MQWNRGLAESVFDWKTFSVDLTLFNPNTFTLNRTTKESSRLTDIRSILRIYIITIQFFYNPETLFLWSTFIFKFLFITNLVYKWRSAFSQELVFLSSDIPTPVLLWFLIYKKGIRYLLRYPNNLINLPLSYYWDTSKLLIM